MIRKIATLILGLFAVGTLLLAFVPTQDAQAQTTCTDYDVAIATSGCLVYPAGGFTPQSTPVPTATPGPTSAAVVSADTVEATTGGGGSSGGQSIAFTGAESRVLGYAGAGLIGLGAVALAVARRQSDSDLD